MNIETVAKGLECCSKCLGCEDCEDCPYYQSIRCNVEYEVVGNIHDNPELLKYESEGEG